MNFKGLLLLLVFLFAVNCLNQLPDRYVEITAPKDIQLLLNDVYFSQGLDMCVNIWLGGGGSSKPTLYRVARYIQDSKNIYYYIELAGNLGVKAFIFKVTYQ